MIAVAHDPMKEAQRKRLAEYIDTDLSFAHILSNDDREELVDLLCVIEENGYEEGLEDSGTLKDEGL